MDESAIRAIADLAVDAQKANRLDTFTPAILIGDGPQSIERLMAGRSRYRGKFATRVLSAFAEYLRSNPGGQGFIDPATYSATAFLNLGTTDAPGHGDWSAKLDLEKSAPYAAVLAINGMRKSQRELVEWIEDWTPHLGAIVEGLPDSIANATKAIRELTISAKSDVTHTDKDFGASRSALEDIEARARGGLPSHLTFACEPFVGFAQRTLRLRLSVITGDKPALCLRVVSLESVVEDIANEFQAKLEAAVGDAADLTIGSFTP